MPLSDKQTNISLNSLAAVRRIEDKFIKNIASTGRRLERQLTDFLDQNRNLQAVDVALARADVEQIMLQSGYFDVTGDLLNQGYQDAIEESFQLYQSIYGRNLQLGDVSLQRLDSLKQLDLNSFTGLSNTAVDEMNRVLIDMQFGTVSFDQAVNQMREQIVDKMQRHAQTWVTTGVSGVYRESSTALAQDNGITKFEYVGPVDAKTRDFCIRHIGETRTEAEWNAIPGGNGQGLPVFTYGGGYNCRHSFVGVI
jgi:NAD-dependent DNA ligase